MKLVKAWNDDYNKIQNSVYELKNGVRLAISQNPSSTDFDLEVIFEAGSYFEDQKEYKPGTSHFLEHMLAGNPNAVFKTKQEFDDFTHGDATKASFFTNAHTSSLFISFDAHGHENARDRMTEYIFAQINYPLERFKEFIEKERNIIVGEINQKENPDKSSSLNYNKFFFGDVYPILTRYVLGTEESVKGISVEELEMYYKEFITSDNCVIAIQTPKELDKQYLKKLEKHISDMLRGQVLRLERKSLDNTFKYKHHFDDKRSGIFLSINRFYDLNTKYDYEEMVSRYFYKNLINEVTFRKLREEKHLVYSGGGFSSVEGLNFRDYGFNTEFSVDRFAKVLDEIHELLTIEIPEFITSSESDIWFQGIISRYIFDRNPEFDADYASHIAYAIHAESEYDYNFETARNAARSMTKNKVLEFYNKMMEPQPGFWFISSLKDEEIYKVFQESKLFRADSFQFIDA